MSAPRDRFERDVSALLAEIAPSHPPTDLIPETERAVDDARRWPRWLALIKEPPMRTPSHLTVGSPTVRVAAILVATLLFSLMLAGAGLAGARLLAADGTIVVAQDGSGTVETITEAVAMAEDGDTIRVRPGTYVEAVTIGKDITMSGDGPRDAIVIEAPEDGPLHEVRFAPYAILIEDSDARVSGLTLRGEPSRLFVDGGAPVIEDVAFVEVSRPFTGSAVLGALVIEGESTAIVRGNELIESGQLHVFGGPDVRIEANVLRDGPGIAGAFGDATVIRDNEISRPGLEGITFLGPTAATVEGNTIRDASSGITYFGTGVGLMPVIRDNVISGTRNAINVPRGASPTIRDNELIDNELGIGLNSSDARLEGNLIREGNAGIFIHSGGSPFLSGNTVEGAVNLGIFVGPGTSPTLIGNRVCGSAENLVVDEGAEPVMEDNDICPDAPVEATE